MFDIRLFTYPILLYNEDIVRPSRQETQNLASKSTTIAAAAPAPIPHRTAFHQTLRSAGKLNQSGTTPQQPPINHASHSATNLESKPETATKVTAIRA
jgi:hypothetical protein